MHGGLPFINFDIHKIIKLSASLKHISRFLSLVLRHKPEEIGLFLDDNGWADVNELIQKMQVSGFEIDHTIIEEVVQTNDKKRFAFNADKSLIRASQGHSIEVELNLAVTIPPAILYHGTTERFLKSIFTTGLQKQKRQYVHLSEQPATAKTVGARYGKPVVLQIDAKAMHDDGFIFYLSENKVWLTDAVPVQYINR